MRHWIKRDTSQLHDLRFASISAEAERTYGRLYLLAGQLDADGMFLDNGKPLTDDEIAYRIRIDPPSLKKAIRELTKSSLLHVNGKGPQISDWKREQVDLKKVRQQTRERVRRYRSGVTEGNALQDEVTPLEEEEIKSKRVLLLLSASARKTILDQYPSWVGDAIKQAEAKQTDEPEKYAAGILRNWLIEGRKEKRAPKGKQPSAKKLDGKHKRL